MWVHISEINTVCNIVLISKETSSSTLRNFNIEIYLRWLLIQANLMTKNVCNMTPRIGGVDKIKFVQV